MGNSAVLHTFVMLCDPTAHRLVFYDFFVVNLQSGQTFQFRRCCLVLQEKDSLDGGWCQTSNVFFNWILP